MSALRTLANPEQYAGFDVRLAVDDLNCVWFAAEDLTVAAGAAGYVLDNLVMHYPKSWFMQRDGLPLMINEAGAYCIAFKFHNYALADWLANHIIVRERYSYPLQVQSVDDRISNARLKIDVCQQLSSNESDPIRSVLIDVLRDCCNAEGRTMPDREVFGASVSNNQSRE